MSAIKLLSAKGQSEIETNDKRESEIKSGESIHVTK